MLALTVIKMWVQQFQASHPDTTVSIGKKDPSLSEVRIPLPEQPSQFPFTFLWPRLGQCTFQNHWPGLRLFRVKWMFRIQSLYNSAHGKKVTNIKSILFLKKKFKQDKSIQLRNSSHHWLPHPSILYSNTLSIQKINGGLVLIITQILVKHCVYCQF